MLKEHLAIAETHVLKGARCVEMQIALVDRLKTKGLSTTEAEKLLGLMQDVQAIFEADRDRLRLEVASHA